MLAIRHLTAGYGPRPVLRDVTADIAPGSFVGLIGPNGSGKTTLLRAASGVLVPSSGEVFLEGTRVHTMDPQARARRMACLSQDLSLDLAFTVREVVLLGRSPYLPRLGGETPKDLAIAERAMQRADVGHLADRAVTALSGGERRRAFIAMCLAQEPRLFLLDEPTTHLDVAHQLSVLDLILRLNREEGMTVVAVFHDLNLAAEYCERLVVMNRGEVVAVGSPEEVVTVDRIARVYGAHVVIERNPVSGKPHVIVTAGKSLPPAAPARNGPDSSEREVVS